MDSKRNTRLAWGLAGLVLLGWATASPAQTQGVGGGGGAQGGAGGGGGAGGSGPSAPSAMPFSGGQALQGGLGALGSQQGGAGQSGTFSQQLAPATSSGYGTTSFLGPYYANPLSIGIPSSKGNTGGAGVMGSSKPTFGQALYNTSSSGGGQFGGTSGQSNFGSRQSGTFSGGGGGGASGGTRAGAGGQTRASTSRQGGNTLGGGRTSLGAAGGQGGFQGAAGGGFGAGGSQLNSYGPQAIAYQTTMGYPVQTAQPARIRADLQAVIARTSALPSRTRIQAMAQGEGVVLRGTVGSDQERRLAEAIARLSPGVTDLRNELEVRETAPPPKPLP